MHASVHTLESMLQGAIVERVGGAFPYPSPAPSAGGVANNFLPNLHFVCGGARDGELAPVREDTTRAKERAEGISNLLGILGDGAIQCPHPPHLHF